MLDVDKIRQDFPILEREINGHKLVYFDNAASSLKPVQVVKAISEFYLSSYSNVHRGVHTLSQEASRLYEEAHEAVARFINCSTDEVVFTKNTTESLNMVAYGLMSKELEEGDNVAVGVIDHHSNMLPWRRVAGIAKISIRYFGITEDGDIDYEELGQVVDERTKVVALTHVSNVLGTIVDVKKAAKIAREVGAIVVLDGAQSVPHMPVNVKELDVDFLAFSGHKMLGPTGIGVLYGKRGALEELEPVFVGGGAVKDVTLGGLEYEDLPWRLEAGTPNIAGGIGLAKAVEYLSSIGMEDVRSHEKSLTEYALSRLSELEYVEVYGAKEASRRAGVISFNVKKLDPNMVGLLLDSFGIAVRTGKHCAHPLHYHLKVDGSVRASFYIYNMEEEVDRLIEALESIAKEAFA